MNLLNFNGLKKHFMVKKKRNKKLFNNPQITSIQKEINSLKEECFGLGEDLEDYCAEYEAYDDEEVVGVLLNDLPLRNLQDFSYFESGVKIESNLNFLTARKNVRKQIENSFRDLQNLEFEISQKKIDLLLAKTDILLRSLA